ncbi:MAG: PD40 domain-containing protein [Gammaproteobacteria bacterium]|nr:PD40 domain-containing protein [Gammaproteobacteria bacterium]
MTFSPDGRWLAYTSNETGRNEIYIRPYPDVEGGKWLVSQAGGRDAKWADDGASLFYVNAVDHSLMSAQIFSAGNGIEIAPASEVLTLDNIRYSSISYEPISGDEGFFDTSI